MSRRAAQHPRYPTGSVPRKTERIEATCGSCFASVSGEKNRCIATSTTADIPPLTTAAILVSQLVRGTNCGDVLASTRCVTRSGACAATHCPMAPPNDKPQKANCEIFNRSAKARISLPNISIEYSPAVASEAPWPRVSYRKIWKRGSRFST